HERLGQRIGEPVRVPTGERRVAPVAARQDEQDVDAVSEEGDADDDPAELAPEEQVGPGRAHERRRADQEQCHDAPSRSASPSASSSASPSRIISISPTTIRYTPVSNTVAVVSFTW